MTVVDLVGTQTPRIRSVPAFTTGLGQECVDFAAQAGLFLDPWQQSVIRDSMGLQSGGKWTAPQVGLLVPRQNGKGSILEARELFGLFALGEPLIIHSAHKFDTSQEHYLRMRNLIDGSSDLSRHVKAMPTANGKESIVLTNGNRLKFKARTISGAGRGFSSDLLVLDEAMLLPEQALDAMMPTLITRKNPQTWFTSSAGNDDSAALWRIVKAGRAGSPRLAYFEWGSPSSVDPDDRQAWADANPGLGHRIPVQALEDDLGYMTAEGFAREHLGVWDDALNSSAIDATLWAGLAAPDETQQPRPFYGLATAPDRSWSCLAAAWRRADGVPQLSIVRYAPGTSWVEEAASRLRPAPLVDVAARNLLVNAVEVSQQDMARRTTPSPMLSLPVRSVTTMSRR